MPVEVLQEYVGTYQLDANRGVTVTLELDQLFAQFSRGNPLPIFAESEAGFYFRVGDAGITFGRDATGAVTQLTFRRLDGRETLAEKVR